MTPPQGTSWVPRLLQVPATSVVDLATHVHLHGTLPSVQGQDILADVDDSGLLGRGGAGFPTGRKMRTVAAGGGRTVVVANGCEGEPASGKDLVLLLQSPHLVLDGLALAARAVGARDVHLLLHRGSRASGVLRNALAERERAKVDRVRVQLHEVPVRYVSSEESALVQLLNGGPAKPTFTPPRPFERGVGGRPTLVNNVETLAHIALIVRYGPGWYRSLGDPDEPGTMLMTVSGPGVRRTVLEAPTGTAVDEVLGSAGVRWDDCQAVLVGGYFGTWHAPAAAHRLALTHATLSSVGGSLGAGIVLGLPRHSCGIAETARVASYLAAQSAGQCGPCLNGLPAIAAALQRLAFRPWDERLAGPLNRWLAVVPGRGACRHPDGAIRFITSALRVFANDVDAHRAGLPCRRASAEPFLPVPDPAVSLGPWR